MMHKIKVFLLPFSFFIILGILLIMRTEKNDDQPVPGVTESSWAYPGEEFFLARAYPDPFIDQRVQYRNLETALNREEARSAGGRFDIPWQVQGPGNIGARVNTIAIQPGNKQVILAGYSGGGLFRTADGGKNWDPVFDDKLALAIGDIAFDPINTERVFAGTGDPNIGGYPSVGNGLFKSENGGLSWAYSGLAETGIISKVEVHPADPEIITCSAMGFPFMKGEDRGLYRSYNGGQSWEQILFLSDSTGVIDFLSLPGDPDFLLAAGWDRIRNNRISINEGEGAKIYRSRNGGESWEILDNGLPAGVFSRIGLAQFESDPEIMVAAFIGKSRELPCLSDKYQLAGLYKTLDGGDNWHELPVGEGNGLNCDALGNFGWYFGKVRIHPSSHEEIYLLGVDLWRTSDDGNFWRRIGPPWFTYEVHADKHDLVILDDSLYLATDGGLYKASRNNTDDWADIENIVATQFYRVAYNPHAPAFYYGGAQDNGSTGGNANTINEWPRIFGGDGFQMHFHPHDPAIFYTQTQRGNLYYTQDGGGGFNSFSSTLHPGGTKFWDMPFVMSSHRPDLLYAGSNSVWRASRGIHSVWKQASPDLTKGDTLELGSYPSITAIAESPLDSNRLIAGTQDGKVWTSENFGEAWIDVSAELPDRFVSSVAASHIDKDRLFVAHSAYRDGDNQPFIHISDDGGMSWQSIAGDLPLLSINHIFILPSQSDSVIFVATDGGIYGTIDGGLLWERVGMDFPFIPVYDLTLNKLRNELVAGTFARGIQSFPLDSVSLEPEPMTGLPGRPYDGIDIAIQPAIITDRLQIEWTGTISARAQLMLYDVNGRLHHTRNLHTDGLETLDTSALPGGIYFVTVTDGKVMRTVKIFVSR